MSISPLFRWPNSVNHFKQTQDELQQIAAEVAENRTAVEEQLTSLGAAQQQYAATLEQQLQQTLSTHSHHIQSEFEQIIAENSVVQASLEQKLQIHSQAVLEKISHQETVALQQSQAIVLIENRLSDGDDVLL